MSFPTTYLLNVALHAAALSVFACLLLVLLGSPGRRAFVGLSGLLALGILPWITALRPEPSQEPRPPVAGIATPPPTLPIFTVAIMPREAEARTEIPPASPAKVTPKAKRVYPSLVSVFATLWVIGTGMGLVRLTMALLQVAVWKKSLALPDDAAWLSLHQLVPEAPARPHFRVCHRNVSPCVTGFWRPRIVIPEFLLGADFTEKLRWAVRHEICHWQAGDSRWILIINLIRCLHWWNPLVYHLISRWDDAREQLCDLQAVTNPENRATYGAFLVSMAGRVTKQPPLAIAMAKSRNARRLKRRIVCLLESKKTQKPIGKGFVSLSSGLLVIVSAGVSAMKIGAEEQKAAEVIAEQKTAAVESEMLETQNWMVFSRSAGHWKNGDVLKDGELLPWIEKAKDQGGVTVHTYGRQPYGTTGNFGTRYYQETGWGNGKYKMFEDTLRPGVLYESDAKYEANQTVLSMRAIYRFPPDSGFPLSSVPLSPYSPDKPFRFKDAKAEARLRIGEAVCIDLGEVEPGIFVQAFSMAIPQPAKGRSINTYSGNQIKLPSVDVKGRLKISGVRLDVPSVDLEADLKRLRLPDGFLPRTDSLTWVQPRFQEIWESVLGADIHKLPPVEFPLIEFHQPWSQLPELKFSAYLSEDYKWINLTMMPGPHVLDQEIQNLRITLQAMPISFKLRSTNPKIESRVFLKIEPVKP